MPKIDRSKIPFANNASYPKEFAPSIAGREKQKLGDAVGLTQFGVNIARIKAHSKSALRHWHETEDEFIYMLEGRIEYRHGQQTYLLEPGDALLRWGPEGSSSLRFCHHSDAAEEARLLADLPLQTVRSFESDGRSGRLNRYRVLQRG